MKVFALTGRILYIFLIPRVLPRAKSLLGFQPATLTTLRS